MTMDMDMDDGMDGMERDDAPSLHARAKTPRRPRIALMGEFSAGKSTLSNLLIGASPLPTKVTATQLPPVWISSGDQEPFREDLDGEVYPVDLDRLSEIDPSETRLIRLFHSSDILSLCDIIDMPGISDPNMASDVWERVIHHADAVIWCTHATQAWRQSEAAVWESLDEALRAKSLLLVTRFDKLLTEADRARVMKRVERETKGLFAARLPISLTEAIAAGTDRDRWERSGAEAFTQRFVDLIHELARDLGHPAEEQIGRALSQHEPGTPRRVLEIGSTRIERPVAPERVMPTRVRPMSVTRRPSERPDPDKSLSELSRLQGGL